MKALKILVILIFVSQLSMAQTTKGPIIKFDKQSYNFGEITQGAKAEVDFILLIRGMNLLFYQMCVAVVVALYLNGLMNP